MNLTPNGSKHFRNNNVSTFCFRLTWFRHPILDRSRSSSRSIHHVAIGRHIDSERSYQYRLATWRSIVSFHSSTTVCTSSSNEHQWVRSIPITIRYDNRKSILQLSMIIIFFVVNLIIGTMTQLFGTGEGECSVILLWSYAFASVSLTLWSTLFMWLVSTNWGSMQLSL